jgi:hypothetical protein
LVTKPQLVPGCRHDLHQAHGAFSRNRARIARAFETHDCAYPELWDAEAMRSLGDMRGIRIACRFVRRRGGLCDSPCHGVAQDQQASNKAKGFTPPPDGPAFMRTFRRR